MRSVTALSTAFLMIVSSMAGCIQGLEEIADIIGCSDENAENFDPDATSGSDDLCLFLENEARFMAALGDAMAADPTDYLLDSDSGVSGVQYGIELDGVDPDSGMSVSIEMLSVIMVDLESQSMYNRSMTSYMDMVSIDTEVVWSGTDIMVTTSVGGLLAGEEAGTSSSISRDMSPDLEESLRAASMGMRGMMGMEDLAMSGGMPSFDDDPDHDEDHDEDRDHDEDHDEDRDHDEDHDRDDEECNSDDCGDEGADFDSIDTNQDGFVELEEIEALINDESDMTSEVTDCIIDAASPVFSDADDNDDEKLDEYEFEVFNSDMSNVDIEELCFDREYFNENPTASISITNDEETGIQTMVMQTMDEAGDMSTTIRLHGDGSFHSYEMGMDDGEIVVSVSFSYLTSDMVSIPEIDYTLDRTATPISVEMEHLMVCDDGGLVPVWSVMDGWEDCEDGSDESVGPEPVRYSEVFSDLDVYGTGDLYDLTVTVYFEDDYHWNEDGDLELVMDEFVYFTVEYEFDRELSDGDTGIVFAQIESTSVGPFGGTEGGSPLAEDYEERTYFQSHEADYGTGPIGVDQEINAIEITILDRDEPDTNPLVLDDGVVEFDFNIIWVEEEAIEGVEIWDWQSYYDGYCGWEGYYDATDAGDDSRWWCKISQADSDWDNWWYYCEYHEDDDEGDAWHCTDALGQSEDYEHSAGEDLWSESYDDDDDDEICMGEDEHGVIHYGCDDEEEWYDFPSVTHAHVVNQVANAPIADFELRVLDCDEGDIDAEDDMEDDSEPIWDECTVVMTFPLSGGEIDDIVVDYVDSDEDGMVSSGDISIVSGPVGEYEIQPYDTWAEEYSADSALIGQEVPGFGAFLAMIGLLGAAFTGRKRDV